MTVNPDVRFGKPCIRGMRITVYDILSYLASAADGEERVRKMLKHYEEQTNDEAVAEDEAAFKNPSQTVMKVPNDLVPEIRELIARYKA